MMRLLKLWPFQNMAIGRIHDAWYYYCMGFFQGQFVDVFMPTDKLYSLLLDGRFISVNCLTREPNWRAEGQTSGVL